MDILSRIIDSKQTIDYISILNNRIEELLSPIVFNPSALSYGEYISSLGYYIHCRARDIIKETLEEMDDYFFKLSGRSNRYYSKGYRKREIITLFGHIIYYRHEYIDKCHCHKTNDRGAEKFLQLTGSILIVPAHHQCRENSCRQSVPNDTKNSH